MMRHMLALGVLLAGLAVLPGALHAQQRHGDVNGDRTVSALDAQAILSAVVGLSLPPSFVISNGDSNCDTSTGALDAQIVLSFVIGLNTAQFCVGQNFGPGATVVSITPTNDTTLLVNRGIRLRATLRDANGFPIERPVTWQTSNADLVSIDSARGDTAWVSNHFTATGAADASATVSAFADGSMGSRVIKVFRSYAGIVIVPQRPDTLRQLNGTTTFQTRLRDSLGVLGTFTNAVFTTGNIGIATVPATASTTQSVTALTMGTTYLYAVQQSNPLVRDSVPLIVQLPAQNTCTGTGGTLHGFTTYTTPQTWSPATNPHYVTSTQTFNAGSSLTLQPGTLVCTPGGAFMVFHAGSRLTAIGTATQPIVFKPTSPTDFWAGIQLGDFVAMQPTAPPDTSILRNVVVERASNGSGAINGRERHVVLLDSVTLRQSNVDAVTLMSQGSQMIRSRIDTIINASEFNYAATLGRGALEETTIRVGGAASGIQLSEAATVRQVSIFGGTRGITQTCCADSARFNNVTITGTLGVALQLEGGRIHPASANVIVTGGGAGAYRGTIGSFGHLFPDSLAQETLKNNGRDTVVITGGALVGTSVVARPDIPWVVTTNATVDTLAQLIARPGASFLFTGGGFLFERGGTLLAVGEPAKIIRFRPVEGQFFSGLRFDNPGAAANPANNATVTSTLTHVRIDSASGQGTPAGGICHNSCQAAVMAGDRHRVLIDNSRIHKAMNGAAYLNAPGSQITNSLIDTTGNVSTGYTNFTAAVALGERTLLQNTLVHRSGHIGVFTTASPGTDTSARLQNVRIVGSRNIGLLSETGILAGDLGSVRLDSANVYPFQGTLQNFASIARDSVSQLLFLGNENNIAIITAGTLRGQPGVHTAAAPLVVEAIPGLRWQVHNGVIIDSLARLHVRPGSDFTMVNANFSFQSGGTLQAVGEAAKIITFHPLAGSGTNFTGLQFQNVGTTPNPVENLTAQSVLAYVRLDSATGVGTPGGGICHNSCQAAINAGDRHRVLIDNARIHRAWSGAVYLNTPGSQLTNSVIDTTGTVTSNYVSNSAAIALGEGTLLQNTLVHRSGQVGVFTTASPPTDTSARLQNVRIVGSQNAGLLAETGVLAGDFGSVRIDSANAYAFQGTIQNFAILARDSVSQLLFRGNADDVIVISGGTLRGRAGVHTIGSPLVLEAIPGLRWQVNAASIVDTLAQLRPRAGTDFTFHNGNFSFQSGGTLNAVGESGKIIRFRPLPGFAGNFNGLQFQNVGTTSDPSQNLTAVSTLTWVRLDSASGMGTPPGGLCHFSCQAAINGSDRHRVMIDNARIHKSWSGAIYLNTAGSEITNSLVDTTGTQATTYTANSAAVALGERILMQNTTVHRSGHMGVTTTATPAADTSARLQNVRIVASLNAGLQAEQGILAGDHGTVRIDSANAYAFIGTIQNLAAITRDSASQEFLRGNVDNVVVVTGGALRGTPGVHSAAAPLVLEASPAIRWQVNSAAVIDSLAQLRPRPGTDFTFHNANFSFQSGGTLDARGEAAKIIRFRPLPGFGGNFNGLQFQNVGTTLNPAENLVATSVLSYVRLDSASGVGSPTGGMCVNSCTAAINTGNRHRLTIDNAVVRKAWSGAIYLATSGSTLSNSVIDTTGNQSTGYTANSAALALGDTTTATNTVVRRSGQHGLYVDGPLISITGVRIVHSRGVGIHVANNQTGANGGSQGLTLSGFVVDSTADIGVWTDVLGVQFNSCSVLRSGSHGFFTNGNLVGVGINSCNIEDNGGFGVANGNAVTPDNANLINATNNFWAILGVSTPPTPSATPVANGASLNVNASAPAGTRFP